MILELLTSVYIFFNSSTYHLYVYLNVLTILLIWLSTFIFSLPCHRQLQKGKDDVIIEKLIKSNWPRTFLWFGRVSAFVYFLIQVEIT